MSRSDGESARNSRAGHFTIIVLFNFSAAAAAYGQCPSPPTAVVEQGVTTTNTATSAAAAMDSCGRFTLGWRQSGFSSNDTDVLVRQYATAGTPVTILKAVSADEQGGINPNVDHDRPSLAMSAGGLATVSWNGWTGESGHYRWRSLATVSAGGSLRAA